MWYLIAALAGIYLYNKDSGSVNTTVNTATNLNPVIVPQPIPIEIYKIGPQIGSGSGTVPSGSSGAIQPGFTPLDIPQTHLR